ncbi:hypothetical protein L1987_18562 [Smallanthus sonchifolius]|uniref:Uncharacterized protein n=1 Tax=Smallanthus sonchifolius TaxID=185202 RepID=A0ACB9J152_9ASTR|nr:hypothetical protein L1987_18562 [Smallanthus sonchifolius]
MFQSLRPAIQLNLGRHRLLRYASLYFFPPFQRSINSILVIVPHRGGNYDPIFIWKMHNLFDENGRRYLDAFAGIVTVCCGHCHPEILSAIEEQNKLLQHASTIYLHHAIAANELAMLMARLYSGNLGMIALRNAYHGGSAGTIGLTALNTWKYPIPEDSSRTAGLLSSSSSAIALYHQSG